MITYAEREIFDPHALNVWRDASEAVKKISPDWGNELRCHELSRAVYRVLYDISFKNMKDGGMILYFEDGLLYAIEHSWLVLRGIRSDNPTCFILDVYSPGRMPAVQLVHDHFSISRGYKRGELRYDVNWDIVDRITHEMLRKP